MRPTSGAPGRQVLATGSNRTVACWFNWSLGERTVSTGFRIVCGSLPLGGRGGPVLAAEAALPAKPGISTTWLFIEDTCLL